MFYLVLLIIYIHIYIKFYIYIYIYIIHNIIHNIVGRRQCKTTLLGAQSFMPAEQQQQNYSILASVI